MLALWAMFVFNKFSGLMLFSFARALATWASLAGPGDLHRQDRGGVLLAVVLVAAAL